MEQIPDGGGAVAFGGLPSASHEFECTPDAAAARTHYRAADTATLLADAIAAALRVRLNIMS
jgi:hypothetical protein